MYQQIEKKLKRLLDKSEIIEQLCRWSRGTARKDWDLVRSVFHPDARDDHGTFDGSLEDFIGWQKKHHAGVDQSVHFLGNFLIDFVDDTHAFSESYVIAFHHYPDEGSRADIVGPEKAKQMKEMTSVIVGRYLDKFEKRNDVWRISYRQAVFETLKTEEAGRNLLSHWITSQRDDSDPIYKIRAEMGLGKLAP